MCACRQKKSSFLIEDILQDVKKKPYKNLSNEPTQPLKCKGAKDTKPIQVPVSVIQSKCDLQFINQSNNYGQKDSFRKVTPEHDKKQPGLEKPNFAPHQNNYNPLDVQTNNTLIHKEEDQDVGITGKINLEQRRNTYPLYPMALKANIPQHPWGYGRKEARVTGYTDRPQFSYYSDTMLNSSQVLRNQLAANRFVTHPYTIRHAYGFDRVAPGCCNPWWGLGGRRKGGQVRFTATQTGALERRFNANKYLSPDERRALANTLRLSDRQVKTWFQNRRAKWRRTTPEAADAGSPPTNDECSDDEVHIADD